MPRSSDNTLMAKLGFRDPDRSSDLHTLACQYLCREDISQKVVERFLEPTVADISDVHAVAIDRGEEAPDGVWVDERWFYECGRTRHSVRMYCGDVRVDGDTRLSPVRVSGETEVVQKRGRGGFLVGFVDVLLTAAFSSARGDLEETGEKVETPGGFTRERHVAVVRQGWRKEKVCIEVKTGRVDVAQIAMQMALYQETCDAAVYVAALTWRLHPEEKAQLKAKGIEVLWLGPPFERYCESRRSSDEVVDEEAF